VARGRAEIVVENVDERPAWRSAYGLRIPVVCLDEEELCAVTLDRAAVLGALERRASNA
jgi:hypothetical protein